MSEMGQTRRFDLLSITSALPPTSDVSRTSQYFAFVPNSDIASLNHLVGGAEHRRRDRQAERLRSSKVDDEFDLGSLMYRQSAGFSSSRMRAAISPLAASFEKVGSVACQWQAANGGLTPGSHQQIPFVAGIQMAGPNVLSWTGR
jgi:hypothetical protein